MSEHAPGWYNDPYGRFQLRHWDGTKWTEHVATNGVAQDDPLGASTVIPIATPASAYTTPAQSDPPNVQGFSEQADPGDPNAQAAAAEAAEPSNRITAFLDGLGPDARLRPRPALRSALAGLGGVAIAVGLLLAVGGDEPSRGLIAGVAFAIIVAAWLVRTFVGLEAAKAAAVGMVVVGIPTFAIAATVDDNQGGVLTGLIGAALFLAAWALPGFRSRNLLLGLGALALITALGSLTADDNSDIAKCDRYLSENDWERFDAECQDVYYDGNSALLPEGFTDNLGEQGVIYLAGASVFLGLTWWLDRRGYHGTATGLCAAGLASALIGTTLLANEFGSDTGPALTLVVGLLVCVVGTHGSRRATTWWGAALAAMGLIALVALQWEPASSGAAGGVAIVSGLLLVGVALLSGPIRAAFAQRSAEGSVDPPQPPSAFAPPTG